MSTPAAPAVVSSAPDASAAASAPQTALDFNLPKGDQFFFNKRGQRLHLRVFLPAAGVETKAVLFWYHGYAAHVNGPTLLDFADGMTAGGFAVVAVDQHGHGYSDGERVLITNYNHLLEDNLGILDVVTQGTPDGEKCSLGLDGDIRSKMTTLPFFLGGQSLGGAMSLMIGMRIRGEASRAAVAARFVGVMLNCPAIRANPPPKPVLFILKHVIAPLMPAKQLPRFMEKVSVPEKVWTRPEHMAMGALDKVGQPGGLGWPGTMRLGTGSQLLDMLAELGSTLSKIDFPFLVLHDPEDGVVRFDGTESLMEESSTPAEDKELKKMLGLKHDLLSNATPQMLAAYLDWSGTRLEAFGVA